jgi:hypothetical protein
MLMTIAFGVMLATSPAIQAKPAALPDTPQGRQIEAYIKAFNSGDEKTFLDAQDRLFTKTFLARRDRTERATMYKRLRGTFGKMSVSRVVKASPLTIQLKVPSNEGVEADMTFDFDEVAPYRIAGLGVEIQVQGGPQ